MAARSVKLSKFSIALIRAITISLPIAVYLATLEKCIAEQRQSQPLKLDQLAYF